MRTLTLLGASLASVYVGLLAACGSSDSKKQQQPVDDGGADGSSTAGGRSGTGGRGAGNGGAGTGGVGTGGAGTGGAGTGGTGAGGGDAGAGAGGSPAADGGDGGSLAASGIFFSVDRQTRGLAGTGVAAESASPETTIFASAGRGPSESAGTNAAIVTAAQLGLLDTDDLDAISVLRPVPASPLYYYSVRDAAGLEGYTRSDVNRSAEGGDVAGDVFTSDGVGATFDVESGTRPGANALFVDESRLGLVPSSLPDGGAGDAGLGAAPHEDLDALEVGLTAVPDRVYFSVRKGAAGPAASALAGVPAAERGCTLFQSSGDGTHTVTATCADLGLAPGDEIDALAVQGTAAPSRFLFSVQAGSVGLPGTEVATQALTGESAGDIFSADGEGSNQLLVDEAGLGLASADDLDALAFEDVPRPPLYQYQGTPCQQLSPPPVHRPDGTQGFQITGRAVIDDDIVAYLRYSYDAIGYDVIAYDGRTCAPVGAAVALGQTIGTESSNATPAFTFVTRPGWTRTSPLTNVDLWAVMYGLSPAVYLARYADARGQPANYARISPDFRVPEALVYRSAENDFGVFYRDPARAMILVPTPTGAGTSVTATSPRLVPYPCNEQAPIAGYDAPSGGFEVLDPYERMKRICRLDADLWSREPARTWAAVTLVDGGPLVPSNVVSGAIVPGAALHLFEDRFPTEHLVTMPPMP